MILVVLYKDIIYMSFMENQVAKNRQKHQNFVKSNIFYKKVNNEFEEIEENNSKNIITWFSIVLLSYLALAYIVFVGN